MTWEEDLPVTGSSQVAKYSAQLCKSEEEIDNLFHFNSDPAGFAFYRSQIQAASIWPMAVLLDIEVPFEVRRRGIGSAAVQRFVNSAREKGATLGFLRVGWVGEMSERDWLVSWYLRLGWHALKNPADHLIVPFMYRKI